MKGLSIKHIYDEDGQGFTTVYSADRIEKVNPVEFYEKSEIIRRAIELRGLLELKDPQLASDLDDRFFVKQALKTLEGFFDNIRASEFHPNLLELFITERKKDQVKLLKGISLNPDQFTALIFKTYEEHEYLYSRYKFELLPTGFENKKLPKLFEITEDGSIRKVGETDLSDGELKHIIENRKVIISHFFDKGSVWHCFFNTYRSIGGRENWRAGQPHFHYISSSFGISREDFKESMKNGNYKSTPIHITLTDYGNQPESDKVHSSG